MCFFSLNQYYTGDAHHEEKRKEAKSNLQQTNGLQNITAAGKGALE
jgi:hypothetical protein